MSKKAFVVLGLCGLVLGAVAVSGIRPAPAQAPAPQAVQPVSRTTFDAVRRRGTVICGVNTGVAGFSTPDAQGQWRGIDIDLCRAIAAAALGDATRVRFVPTTAVQRFVALQSGEIDVLTRNATQTFLRDTSLGLHMAGVNFYDGQGFMVRRSAGISSVRQLDGATICVQPGTTNEQNLADWSRNNNVRFTPVVIERVDENIAAYDAGRCDAITSDTSQLAAIRVTAVRNASDHIILPERISKEPLGPMVRKGDDAWYALVRWTLTAMIEAEELGITQANVDAMLQSPNPAIRRFLGVAPGYGAALGVDEHWAYNIVKQVGNYGESFERNLGSGSPIRLERGLNDLWTRGGLMYAIPVR